MKDKKNSQNNQKETSVSPKPKILLINLPDKVSEGLKSKGFNVNVGTFGSPYKVEVSREITPVIERPNLPNISEQEIIIIDLTAPDTLDKPNYDYVETEEKQWWVSCSSGIIDPRFLFMSIISRSFDRILNHGGFFVIFAQNKKIEEYFYGRKNLSYGEKRERKTHSNWSFLSILDRDLNVEFLSGEEIEVDRDVHGINYLFQKYTQGTYFNAILKPRYTLEDKWMTLLRNKFGDPVGGLILSDDFNGGGVLILPQINKNTDVIYTILTEVIAELSPHLFPNLEGAKWVQRDEYELEAIKKFKMDKIQVEKEAKKQLDMLDKKIDKEREEFEFLHGILTDSGDKLVEDVKKSLDFIGFKQVVDVDKTIKGDKKLEEDLQIHDESPILLVEIKGISYTPKDSDLLQVHKYIPRRMKKWDRRDVHGVTLINYQKNIPAFKRSNIEKDKIEDVKSHEITVTSTIDLFILIRGMIRCGWNGKVIRDLFYEIGKMPAIPSNYKPIGEIFTYIKGKNIIGINITSRKLYKGQKIGYKINNEFLEEHITSLKVNRHDVEDASSGQASIKTIYNEKELRIGTVVYEVIE